MSVITLTSLCGSPGVSTAALALALKWPRQAVVIEADTSRCSSILPGYFEGSTPASKSLINLALSSAQASLFDANNLWAQLLPLEEPAEGEEPTKWVLPGLLDPRSAPSLDRLWPAIARAAQQLGDTGIDVFVDLGRYIPRDPRFALLENADQILFFLRPTLGDAFTFAARKKEMIEELTESGRADLPELVTVEHPSSPHSSKEVATSLGYKLAKELPWDPTLAAMYSEGRTPVLKGKLEKKPYPRAIEDLVSHLRSNLVDRGQSVTEEDFEEASA